MAAPPEVTLDNLTGNFIMVPALIHAPLSQLTNLQNKTLSDDSDPILALVRFTAVLREKS